MLMKYNSLISFKGVGVIAKLQKESLFFGILLVVFSGYFIYWGFGYILEGTSFIFLLAALFGIFMAFNIGGNDVANSFGTSVGAKTLTIKQALIVAAVFEVSGAMIAGGEVTKTIRKGIVDLSSLSIDVHQFIAIMMSALLAAAIWLLFASKRGLPVSTTHSIIGGIVGSSIAMGVFIGGSASAFELVHWDKIMMIALSWVISPILGGLMAYVIFWIIKRKIIDYNEGAEEALKLLKKEKKELKSNSKSRLSEMQEQDRLCELSLMAMDAEAKEEEDCSANEVESYYYKELELIHKKKEMLRPYKAMELYLPFIAGFGAVVITGLVIFKGIKHMHVGLSGIQNFLIIAMVATLIYLATFVYSRSLKGKSLKTATFLTFSWLQVFTASAFAFSHGSNDIANAIGPFAAVLDALRTGDTGASAPVPPVVMLTFGVALVAGLWFIGKEVIETVGTKLTHIFPASGFAAELGASSVILLASELGIPVSSTHILIGAILGIGLVNAQTNWKLMQPIAMAWIITLPAAGVMSSIILYVLLKLI